MPTVRLHSRIIGIGLAFCGAVLVCPASAQDAFFDDAPGLFAPAAGEAVLESDEAPVDDNPLVAQLLEHSRRGNEQLAMAISSLARIDRWKQVDQLLSGLAKKKLPAATLAMMKDQIESAVFLRMRRNDQLGDEAKAALTQMAQASSAAMESPDLLRRAIAELDTESVDKKLASGRAILRGGNAAVAELVASAVLEKPPASRDDILRLMLKLGDGGVHAMRQLALYGTADVRDHALSALGRIDREQYISDLVTGLYAADATESERAVAAGQLRRIEGALPSRETGLAYLYADFLKIRERANLAANDRYVTTMWSINADRTGVGYQSSRSFWLAYREVVDAAARLRRLGGLPSHIARDALAADVAYRVLLDLDWGDEDQVDAVRKAHGVNASMISDCLDDSLQRDDSLATIGLVRLIKSDASVIERSSMLNHGATPAPLVHAAMSPIPQVRYESALAATRLAAGSAYAGSSYVMKTLSEMTSLHDQPTALLVETRRGHIILLERVLGDLGYHVVVVGSVNELQRCVSKGGDIRLILSKTELWDLPAIELIDLVRRTDRGRDIPIALFGAETAGIGRGRWQTPVVMMDLPASTSAFTELLEEVQRKSRLESLSSVDRQSYRQQASELLP
ncbi:MAG: hypothetical protein AB8B91_00320 [Rubripirellula sp.]